MGPAYVEEQQRWHSRCLVHQHFLPLRLDGATSAQKSGFDVFPSYLPPAIMVTSHTHTHAHMHTHTINSSCATCSHIKDARIRHRHTHTHTLYTHWSWEASWSHLVDTLGIELCLSLLLALVEGNVEWFGDEDVSIHLRHSFSGLLWRAEADKPKALCHSSLVPHDLNREGGEIARGKVE